MTAETLNCPMCGAPASTDATACDHCGARLATVACPSCFGMMFLGAKFCSHCGAKADRIQLDAATRTMCPHCKVNLDAVTIGSTNLLECGHCEGIWMDNPSFAQICASREEQAAVLGMAFSMSENPVAMTDLKVRYYPCPTCKSLMNRVNFAHCSGVIVDICRAHGTWFDKDELRHIVEFIRGGGLDKARAQEIDELKRQRKQLEAARAAAAVEAPSGWNHSSGWPGANYDLVDIGVSAAALALRALLK